MYMYGDAFFLRATMKLREIIWHAVVAMMYCGIVITTA